MTSAVHTKVKKRNRRGRPPQDVPEAEFRLLCVLAGFFPPQKLSEKAIYEYQRYLDDYHISKSSVAHLKDLVQTEFIFADIKQCLKCHNHLTSMQPKHVSVYMKKLEHKGYVTIGEQKTKKGHGYEYVYRLPRERDKITKISRLFWEAGLFDVFRRSPYFAFYVLPCATERITELFSYDVRQQRDSLNDLIQGHNKLRQELLEHSSAIPDSLMYALLTEDFVSLKKRWTIAVRTVITPFFENQNIPVDRARKVLFFFGIVTLTEQVLPNSKYRSTLRFDDALKDHLRQSVGLPQDSSAQALKIAHAFLTEPPTIKVPSHLADEQTEVRGKNARGIKKP